MRTERVYARDLRVGDIFLRGNEHPVKIVDIARFDNEIEVFTEYVGSELTYYRGCFNGDSWHITSNSMRSRVVPKPTRTCAPCYDSDCDCIFDNVEGDLNA